MSVNPSGGDFFAQVPRQPEAPALVWRSRTVTYGELAGLCERARAQLYALNLTQYEPVALSAVKSPLSIALILACQLAEHPVLLVSPDLGAQALARLVGVAGCQYLATPTEGYVDWRCIDSAPAGSKSKVQSDTLFLLSTSGSTGTPKIVPVGSRAVAEFTDWGATVFDLKLGTTVLNYAPLNFDLCLLDIWATLRHGACALLVETERATLPRYLTQIFTTTAVHVVQAVPMLFRLLASAACDLAFPSVRHVLMTGEHTPLRVRAALPALFPRARFHNVYGCTETNDSFMHSFDAVEAASREVLPLGQPLPGVKAAVITDGKELDGPGTGELFVSTPFQTSGYLNDDAPGDRFVARSVGSRTHSYFRTGDLVSRDASGELTLIGRNDFQVKVRGVRVNLEEIERVLLSHEGVADAAVVALPDREAGLRLHAVVRRCANSLTGLRLREHCAGRLLRAAIPAVIHLVDDPLPTTATGKVNRNRIRADLQAEES